MQNWNWDSCFTHILAKGPYAGLLQSCMRAFRQYVCKSIWAFNLILLFYRAKYCINPTSDLCSTQKYCISPYAELGLMQDSYFTHIFAKGPYAGLKFSPA